MKKRFGTFFALFSLLFAGYVFAASPAQAFHDNLNGPQICGSSGGYTQYAGGGIVKDHNNNILGHIKTYVSSTGNVRCAILDKYSMEGTATWMTLSWSNTGSAPTYKWRDGAVYSDTGSFSQYAGPVYVAKNSTWSSPVKCPVIGGTMEYGSNGDIAPIVYFTTSAC